MNYPSLKMMTTPLTSTYSTCYTVTCCFSVVAHQHIVAYYSEITYNNISSPPLLFDWKMGHFPLLWLINDTLILLKQHQVKYCTSPVNSTVPVCVCVCVDTDQALTNGADNEVSPLIKRSHVELCIVVGRWTHTNT